MQVCHNEEFDTSCFYLFRADDSRDDFSYRKCIVRLFPDMGVKLAPSNKHDGKAQSGRKAGFLTHAGRRGPGGARGRGGRGRGRGRGGQ